MLVVQISYCGRYVRVTVGDKSVTVPEVVVHVNDTGCGNTLDFANPAVRRLTLDTLRHFVTFAGVDGFRFGFGAEGNHWFRRGTGAARGRVPAGSGAACGGSSRKTHCRRRGGRCRGSGRRYRPNRRIPG